MLKVATLPAKITQDFFVVGGPVQPDRPCYIRRNADEELLAAIAAERFAYVLAPRATGKTSLMGRAIRRLRADGQMAAVVDLTQIGTRTESVDSARWHYSIAYRISRELRLKVDLQAWWHERNLLLNEQRLVEFFWDIVLVNTTVPVTIFFDEAERAIDLPFSGELFQALQSSYTRRVSEPDYSRLNFVVLGAASPAQLCAVPAVSPFASGAAIKLGDFTLDECLGLAQGLDEPESVAVPLLERVQTWTHGQPYLTQKLLRGIARRGGDLADVEIVAHDLFLAPGISREEPLLSHMRAMLADGSMRGRQAIAMLKRLAKSGEVIDDPASPAQLLLHLGGFVSSDENGMLRFRNRIVERVFNFDWAQSASRRRWQRPARMAAIAAAVLLVLGWYTQVLPRPYIDTLTFVSSDYALAIQAHRRLSRLPGFGGRADRLLSDVMVRRSEAAETVADVSAADTILRDLPDRAELADQLMASFWLRRSESAAHRGERDVALIHAIAAIDAGSDAAGAYAVHLINDDYAQLDQSYHFDRPLADFEVDWERGQIVALDETQRLFRLPLGRSAANLRPVSLPLTALQQVGVTRGLFVDEPGLAGMFQLTVTVEHGRTSDLLVRLRAPSGATAEVGLGRRDGGLEQFIFTASVQNGLLRLADESILGQWEVTVFDRLSGESGRLISWGLSFPGVPQIWDDEPIEGISLPDPLRTEQVDVALAGDGRKAISMPSRTDARGAASVWDLGTEELIADLPLADRASLVQFIAGDHLLVVGPVRAALWQIASAEPVVEIVTSSGFAAPPAISPDGQFFAVAEYIQDSVRVTVLSVENGDVVGSFVVDAWAGWALAGQADYIATIDGSRSGRVIRASTGELLAEFFHERELDRVIAAKNAVVAIDRRGEIFVWQLQDGRRALTPSDSVYLGASIDSNSVGMSDEMGLVSYIDVNGLVNISRLSDGYRHAVFDQGRGGAIGSRLSPSADRLVSAAGSNVRSWRSAVDDPVGQDFGDVSAVAMDSTGEFALLGYRSGKVQLLRGLPASIDSGGAPPVDYFGHRGVVTSLIVNGNGNRAASGASDGLVRVWDTQTRSPSRYLLRHPAGPINALAFSPDDRWLVSAGPGSARVFELDTGTLVNEIEMEGEATAVAFSPDGRIVAVGDSSGNIVLAAPDATQGVQTVRVRSPITALQFGDAPSILASGTADGNLVFWDTLEASATEAAYTFSGPISWIEFLAGDSQVYLQSGAWIHQLDRTTAEALVTASSLLPSRLRSQPALIVSESSRRSIRALANTGGGRLLLADVELGAQGLGSIDAPVTRRDWGEVLGLATDPVTGLVRTVQP